MRWRSGSSRDWSVSSAMAGLEVFEKVDQGLHALNGHGVVQRSPHAAHRLVALEGQQPGRLGFGQEDRIQRLVAQEERHVHARTAGRRSEEHTSEPSHVKISYAVFC